MKTYQITGLGPIGEDGSVDVFTILPKPFHLTPAQAEQFAAQLVPGNDITQLEDGTFTVAQPDYVQPEDVEGDGKVDEPAEKKSEDGSQSSSTASPFRYRAKHEVDAFAVVAVTPTDDNGFVVKLDNSEELHLTAEEAERQTPKVGDYLVRYGDELEHFIDGESFTTLYTKA